MITIKHVCRLQGTEEVKPVSQVILQIDRLIRRTIRTAAERSSVDKVPKMHHTQRLPETFELQHLLNSFIILEVAVRASHNQKFSVGFNYVSQIF